MHDHECCVACLWPAAVADLLVARLPPAADDLNGPRAVRLRWLEDVHRQCHAIVLGIDNIADALDAGSVLRVQSCWENDEESRS